MKNLFFVLTIVFTLTSCSKVSDLFDQKTPQAWEPDVAANQVGASIQLTPGIISSIGSFQIINTNNQLAVSQMVYSFDVIIKNYDAIDSVYWNIGTSGNSGRSVSKEKITFLVNQTITNGQRTTPVILGVRKMSNSEEGKIVEFAVDNIVININGSTKTITPYSQKTNLISFMVN